MPFSLGELAKKIGGELKGDPDLLIYDLSTLEEAKVGQLSYVTTPKFRKIAEFCKASALLVYPGFESGGKPTIILKDPYLGFARAMRHFYRLYPQVEPGIAETAAIAADVKVPSSAHIGDHAVISRGVTIGEGTVISPGAFVGENVALGENCYIFSNVSIRENVKIGSGVVIYPNAVIGSDGFGYCWDGANILKFLRLVRSSSRTMSRSEQGQQSTGQLWAKQ